MSYLGRVENKSSDIRQLEVSSSTSATHTLTWTAPNVESLIVTINGVTQQGNYTVSGVTLTLDTPLIVTDVMQVLGINDIGTTITPAQNSITNDMVSSTAAITTGKISGLATSATTDTTDASNISSGTLGTARMGSGTASSSTILYGNNTWAAAPAEYNDAGLQDDIALLGFKVASNGSLAKYNLVDQTVDDFQDASGIDASASTGEARDSTGKYYKGETTTTVTASGGNAVTTDGDYTVHKFTGSGLTFTTDTAQTIEYLVVAGGGGSGSCGGAATVASGGGGGGEFVEGSVLFSAGSYSITRGDGGAAGTSGASGSDGGDSSIAGSGFTTITADGGGGGGANNAAGRSGGSGGAGGCDASGGAATATGTGRYGNTGGTSGAGANGGAGGGAGAAGALTNDSNARSPVGGAGKASDILVAGTDVYYAGGGSGGKDPQYSGGAGGDPGGGGGEGANGSDQGQCPGEVNTGGGAGGVGNSGNNGAVGGSGIVILRRPTQAVTEGANMTLVSNTTAAQAAPTKGDIVLTYTNGAGTTTLDTDLTAEISADGGSTWTALALASEGSTGSHNIATSHDVTISSTITAPYNMAYRIKTLNQSVSKTTRIQAVSLGWS